MFDYTQHKLALETQFLASSTDEAAQKPSQPLNARKMQSTQAHRVKRKNAPISKEYPPPALNLDKAEEGVGSFAIADLNGLHMQTRHLADGKISVTLKMKDSKA
jgi:hypothetical protein